MIYWDLTEMNTNNTFSGTKKALIYIRVSSEEQVENFSLQTQEEICRRDAKYKGYEILQVFREEGKSAKTIKGRPTLLEMLDFCRKNRKEVSAIFVYRLDRLSRQTSDYLTIRAKLLTYDISIISATEPTGNSPTEKLLETVLASFAQHDNDVRSERTKNGMRARFLAGLITNKLPPGYINEGGFAVKDPETFEIIKRAWDLMATGTKSLREIREIIANWGLELKPLAVHRIFHNKFYCGLLVSPKYPEIVQGQHSPMITEEQFYKVQAILSGRDTNRLVMPRKSRDNEEFPLRRIMRCGNCGTSFTGAKSKGRSTRYSYYFCKKRCVTKSIPVKDLDEEFFKLLKKFTPTEQGIKLYTACMLRTYNKNLLLVQKKKNIADEEIKKLYGLRQTLIEKNMAGTYSDEIFKEQNALIEDKLISAIASKDDILLEKYDINAITDFIRDKFTNLKETYVNSSLNVKRVLLGSISPSGFSWDYPGCSNRGISPLYQPILDVENAGVPFGDPTGSRIPVTRMRIWCPNHWTMGPLKVEHINLSTT